jgi:hypothetical protein
MEEVRSNQGFNRPAPCRTEREAEKRTSIEGAKLTSEASSERQL